MGSRKCICEQNHAKRKKNDVRQGATDRGSASIANLVKAEVQRLQRFVHTANKTQKALITPIINPKNLLARRIFVYE